MQPGTRVRLIPEGAVGTVRRKSSVPGCVVVLFDPRVDKPFPTLRRFHATALAPVKKCECSHCQPEAKS